MIEEPKLYLNPENMQLHHPCKKSKASKIPLLHLADNKKINKSKPSKAQIILREAGIKRINLDKVRKQLKFECMRRPRIEEGFYEDHFETATEEDDQQKPEDEMIQPLVNQMEEEVLEAREMNSNSFPNSLQINEKYAEQLLGNFNLNEVSIS